MQRRGVLLVAGLLQLVGCSSDAPRAEPPEQQPQGCAQRPIERFKELMIVEPAIIDGPDGKNATKGRLSFAYLVEQLAGGDDPAQFVKDWLLSYETPQTVNQFTTSSRPRVLISVLCPWLQRTPENNCSAGCASCDSEVLDMAQAPFRLAAISNRIDLAKQHASPGAGEGRLVFGLTDGPADDPGSPGLDMSLIFEFDHPIDAGHTRHEWARRWHALGDHPDFGPEFRDDVLSLVADFAQAPFLSQARSNERVFDWMWQLREFVLVDRRLQAHGVENTPDQSLNGSAELTAFVKANAQAIEDEVHQVPANLVGADALATLNWVVSGVSEDLRHGFAAQTCGGCHQTEREPVDVNFHVSPFRSGIEKLSPFVHDPTNPDGDDLTRRASALSLHLCE